MQTIKIMLCADDYALTPGVSRGILEALAAGRLTATSAMTNRPSWSDAARDLQSFIGRADIGLHLNLTAGRPLGSMPSLAPNNQFPGLTSLIGKSLTGGLPRLEVSAEIARQLDAFEAAMRRPPDFVDGHQHVQVLPGIRRWLVDELTGRGWAGTTWIRDSSDGLARILARGVEASKALQVKTLAAGFGRMVRAAGFQTNEGFSGFSSFDSGRRFAGDFETFLVAPGKRHLVMCHPGHVNSELAKIDSVTTSRERELEFLLSTGLNEVLSQKGANLATWRGETLTMA